MAKQELTNIEFRYRVVGGSFISPIKCNSTNSTDNDDGTFTIHNIPDANIAAGDFQVRVKALSDKKPSAWLSSETAFNISYDDVTGIIQNPLGLDGLKAWWDFSDESSMSLTGNKINSINDLSGNNNTLISVAGKEPTLENNGGSNSKKYAKFLNGLSDLRKQLTLQEPFVMYMMFRVDADLVQGNTLIDFRPDNPTYPEYMAGIKRGEFVTGISGIQGAPSSYGLQWFDNQQWVLAVFKCGNRYASVNINKEFHPTKSLIEELQFPYPTGGLLNGFWLKFGKSADFSLHEFLVIECSGEVANNESIIDIDLDRNIRNYFMDKFKPSTRETFIEAFGDSITTGVGSSGNNTGYIQRVANAKGFFLKNNGRSGTAILEHDNGQGLIQIYQEDKFDKDHIITLNHGTNISPGDPSPSIEGYRTVINYFLGMGYKKNRIIIISPFYRVAAEGLSTFVAGSKALAEELEVRYIDLFEYMKLSYSVEQLASMTDDGLHPNNTGHQAMADYILNQITDL